MDDRINVTKSFLPPIEEFMQEIQQIWNTHHLTNEGPILKKLEEKLCAFLDVPYVCIVSNGSLALQLAIRAMNLSGKIATTPFTYVATANAIMWEHCTPVFIDINPETLAMDLNDLKQKYTDDISAILPTHVYGNACDIEALNAFAKEKNCKLIYDGAHTFNVKYKGKAIQLFGDATTLSFHATKVFHTVEGGAIITQSKELYEKLQIMKRHGHQRDDYYFLGTNAKMSEIHAAMGICNLKYIDNIIAIRKQITQSYDSALSDLPIRRPKLNPNISQYNYAYYPIMFESEHDCLRVFNALQDENIFPRRYFYPSLNTIPYFNGNDCPVSEDISRRVLCLPLHYALNKETKERIIQLVKNNSKKLMT